jgi:hypothetical protein
LFPPVFTHFPPTIFLVWLDVFVIDLCVPERVRRIHHKSCSLHAPAMYNCTFYCPKTGAGTYGFVDLMQLGVLLARDSHLGNSI